MATTTTPINSKIRSTFIYAPQISILLAGYRFIQRNMLKKRNRSGKGGIPKEHISLPRARPMLFSSVVKARNFVYTSGHTGSRDTEGNPLTTI
jgi:enamine deaminase RidA (YjgF/YER057c/UK114 family)